MAKQFHGNALSNRGPVAKGKTTPLARCGVPGHAQRPEGELYDSKIGFRKEGSKTEG